MKREVKVVWASSIVAAAVLLIPIVVAHVRANRENDLLNRKSGVATLKFRNRIRSATQIKVFFGVVEADAPGNQISPATKPNLVLRGEDVSRFVRALHFEWGDGSSVWNYYRGPYAGSVCGCTALQFCSGEQTLADLRVGMEGGGDLRTRWYAPPLYIGDSRLLPESREFLERKFNRRLSGLAFF